MWRAWSRSSFACLTAVTFSIFASSVIVSGSMLMTDAAGDVVDHHRPVGRGGDRLEVLDDPALGRLVVVRRDDEHAVDAELVRPLGQVHRCDVEYVPVPATTVAWSPTASSAAE